MSLSQPEKGLLKEFSSENLIIMAMAWGLGRVSVGIRC